jgi:hypothetical protein
MISFVKTMLPPYYLRMGEDHKYRKWQRRLARFRARHPVRRKEIGMNDEQFIEELKQGGVAISKDCMLALLQHDGGHIILEVPWEVGAIYAMTDIMRHANLLLARMRVHSPKRLRIEHEHDVFRIRVVA